MADKKEKSKKKEKMNINLPKAKVSSKRVRETKQHDRNREDLWKAVGIICGIILFFFIIMGGINQRMFWEEMKIFGQTVGEKVSEWIHPEGVEVNDDGVYWHPENGNDLSTQQEKNK